MRKEGATPRSDLTDPGQTETGHVNGAGRKCDPHDNVQDRAENNFPSNGFAGHVRSFRMLPVDDTILLSRGTGPFCC